MFPTSQVFGNWGEDSGTGVMFTRNPSTGFNENFGEYLVNAVGSHKLYSVALKCV